VALEPAAAACLAVIVGLVTDHLYKQSSLPRSGLAQLYRLQLLEALDLGWCRAVGDADAAALGRLPLLRELNLARTQVF